MFKNTYSIGVLLYGVTMALFLIAYALRGPQYYLFSLRLNSFVLPLLYCAAAFFSVRYLWVRQRMDFRKGFSRAFVPMFLGGCLSFLSIFIFLNYIDPSAKALLNQQFVQQNRQDLTSVYTKERARLKTVEEKVKLDKDYNNSLQSFAPAQVAGKDMFSAPRFASYFGAVLIFYLILSLFFGAFFRSRSQN